MTGGELHAWRMINLISQARAAMMLGITRVTLAKYERDHDKELPRKIYLAWRAVAG